MKYVMIEAPKSGSGDEFTFESDDLLIAVQEAEYWWEHLSYSDKRKKTIYVIESENPDEDAENHFDGNYLWRDGENVK